MPIGKYTQVGAANDAVLDIVPLADAKNYLRVTNTEDDEKITSQLEATIYAAESFLNVDILSRDREQFIEQDTTLDGKIDLYDNNISSITEVEVDGTELVLDEGYELIGPASNPIIKLNTLGAKNLKISFTTAGLNNGVVKQGILALLDDLYQLDSYQEGTFSSLTPYRQLYI